MVVLKTARVEILLVLACQALVFEGTYYVDFA